MPLLSFHFVAGTYAFTVRSRSIQTAQACADLVCPRGTPILMGFTDSL